MAKVLELHPELRKLVGEQPRAERIATGFTFTEGPVWDHRRKRLFFSDVRGDTIYTWTADKGHTVFRQPSAHANGNTIDGRGLLVSCEHAGRRLARTETDGSIVTLVDNYEGKRLNSPNDIICTSSGDLIFTDPPYGLRQPDGSFAEGDLGFNGVFRLSTDGKMTLLIDDFDRPNGLLLNSPESRLFVDDTERQNVRVFDVAADGSLKNGRVFAELDYRDIPSRPDGMKMDVEGNIYVAGNTPEGLWVFDPEGVLLGLIGVGEGPANLAWGGDDWQTLFVTARTSVYRLRMRVAGMPVG
jgi:sugar lactone lactonase YvrE